MSLPSLTGFLEADEENFLVPFLEVPVHGGIKDRVDATIQPGKVGSNHVEHLGGLVLGIKDVE